MRRLVAASLAASLVACERLPEVHVTCIDPRTGGAFEGDLDDDAAIETPDGWVLLLDRAPPEERVVFYPICRVRRR